VTEDLDGWDFYDSIDITNTDENGYHKETVRTYTKEINGEYFYKTVVTPLVLREYKPIDGKGSSIFEWVEKCE
jgi:hypothetical protein